MLLLESLSAALIDAETCFLEKDEMRAAVGAGEVIFTCIVCVDVRCCCLCGWIGHACVLTKRHASFCFTAGVALGMVFYWCTGY